MTRQRPRSRSPRPWALGGAATLALACLAPLASGTAVAAEDRVPTPAETARIQARMLTRDDVPAALRISPGWEFTIKAHADQHQSLCDKNGQDIEGRATDLLYQVELGETNAEVDPTAVEQKVWPYRTSTQALREWQVIQERVKKCVGRSEWTGQDGGRNVQILSHGNTTQRIQGRQGIWIFIDARGSGFDPESEDGGYYVLFPVGNTIQSVEYDFPDARGLSPLKRNMVNELAVRLGERWLRMS